MDPHQLSDEALLRRASSGSEESFTMLYRRHQGRIFRFAFEMSGSGTIAEEVTQEVFVALLNGDCAYDASRGRLLSFLMGVARNHALRLLRRHHRYAVLGPDDEPASAENAPGKLIRSETVEAVRRAVLSLPEPYREVVALCDLEELGYAEAAEALQCPIGTVRSRLHRARALLAEKLSTAGVQVSET